MSKEKLKVLFLCTGNSCRSQIAEGLVNHDLGDRVQAFSAGLLPGRVHPKAIQVMKEIGIDISHHRSKHFKEFKGQSFDYVITLCDEAQEACPVFPGTTKQHHFGFTDPVMVAGAEDQVLTVFKKVRDEIHKEVVSWLKERLSTSP
jgi:arsenate reductase